MSSAVTTLVLAAIPSPDRGVWHLGPIPIRAYALCIIAGIVVAVLWGERRFVARGGEPGMVTDIAVFAVPFGLVGGRLYHVATDWQTYFGPNGNPVDALKIWQGGLGIWGAIALGALGAWIGCRRNGVSLPFFADAVAPGIVTAQAIGRIGNWFNQELYGAPTTLPWGLEIYRRVNPETGAPDSLGGVALDRTPIEVVHPTFLYELLWNLAVAALVVWADRRFRLGHGRAFAVYVAGYTAGRFWIEQMRTDYATRVFGDVRINVVVSALVFLAAVAYLLLVRKPREGLVAGDEPSDDELADDEHSDDGLSGDALEGAAVPVAAGSGRSSAEAAEGGLETLSGPRRGTSSVIAEQSGAATGSAVAEAVTRVAPPAGLAAAAAAAAGRAAAAPAVGRESEETTVGVASDAAPESPASRSDLSTGSGQASPADGVSTVADPAPADPDAEVTPGRAAEAGPAAADSRPGGDPAEPATDLTAGSETPTRPDPASAEPRTGEPAPTEPRTGEPASTERATGDPTPAAPATHVPAPAEPAVNAPGPAVPAATEPATSDDPDPHGPGLRDGRP